MAVRDYVAEDMITFPDDTGRDWERGVGRDRALIEFDERAVMGLQSAVTSRRRERPWWYGFAALELS
jgi:hypothetical protein